MFHRCILVGLLHQYNNFFNARLWNVHCNEVVLVYGSNSKVVLMYTSNSKVVLMCGINIKVVLVSYKRH